MCSTSKPVLKLLTIAGSDSGGGAGVQADLKTFNSLEAYGLSVITAVTSQNTMGVKGVEPISSSMVSGQLEAVIVDIEIDAIKTGMLHSAETIIVIQETLIRLYPSASSRPIFVIDPVMVSTSGHDLLQPTAVKTLVDLLLPLATIVTPNIEEAILLAGWRATHQKITSLLDMQACARVIAQSGPKSVLITGGHFLPENPLITDVLYELESDTFQSFCHPRIQTRNTHGTGCTLSAALTAYLAKGLTVSAAVSSATRFVEGAMASSFEIGKGFGPLNHHHSIVQRPIPLASLHNPHPFTSGLIKACQSQWTAFTSTHPFLQSIKDGTLPLQCFRNFLRQEHILFAHHARVCSLMGFKSDSMKETQEASQLVQELVEESNLHINICKAWGLCEDDLHQTDESNPTVAYTRYVMDVGFSKSMLHLRVAIAPFLLGYGHVGLGLIRDPDTVKEGNPYWAWINLHASGRLQSKARIVRDILESAVQTDMPSAKTVGELTKIFGKAVALQLDLWQMGSDYS